MLRRLPFRTWLLIAVLAVLGTTAASHALPPPVVLHEFIPPDSKEDIELSATTSDGRLPAAVETPSGVVEAPDTSRSPTQTEKAYGESGPADTDARYNPDRDTRRPVVARYDDPFSPATAPYKRLRAFDAVAPDFSLTVADPALRPVPEGGSVRAGEDVFFGDVTIDVAPGDAVRIPSVGPGARVVRRSVVPLLSLEILHDGADNWFARATIRARVRLIEQLAIPRDVFGGPFPDGRRGVSRVPPNVAKSVGQVVRSLGLADETSSRAIVTRLVSYFRSFEPSEEPPSGQGNIYLDLALSRKGVCRHRAYAFVVTALGMGIPSRMVVNEAHAWVEVFDGNLWRRIDLGGAAINLQPDDNEPDRPAHVTPEDPFPWPDGSDSGAAMAQRARDAAAPRVAPHPTGSAAATVSSGGAAPAPAPFSSVSYDDPSRPPASLDVTSGDGRVMRGAPLSVEGTARTDLGPCAFVRIDVLLWDAHGARQLPIGSLSTDADGHFQGSVVVPLEVPVGDYDLLVSTPGDARCGPARTNP